MLKHALHHPLRLFIIVAGLALLGVYYGLQLPMALYPQTSRPKVRMTINYGGYSASEFIKKYGANFESQLESIKNTGLKIDHVTGNYSSNQVDYEIMFEWQVPNDQALKEVQNMASSFKGILPKESSDSVNVWQWNENAGFLAVSFFSSKHSMNELYDILDPILSPSLRKNPESDSIGLWNPESEEVLVKLIPEKMAIYGVVPRDVYSEIERSLPSRSGGSLKFDDSTAGLNISTLLQGARSLQNLTIKLNSGKNIYLKDIANIQKGVAEGQSRTFKTNGKDSLILFAEPKSGANVKNMAEEVLKVIEQKKHLFPAGIEYRVLVDPSGFIRGSIKSLISDVLLAAFLAVGVLFLFIGSFKNVATAAIEIPLSLAIALIVMHFTGMNLNLISLGGLALASGMNVDASVVVLENIFKHQERWAKTGEPLRFSQRLNLIYNATREVSSPIILSTITSLIVFIPLALTTDLTSAIMGDLAKAVIYSHAISALVAIFFVPTIRLLVMSEELQLPTAPLEKQLGWLEEKYIRLLERLIGNFKIKLMAVALPLLMCALMVWQIAPRLPKEIVGTPDTDWVYLWVKAVKSQNSRHFENIIQEVESKALGIEGEKVSYTFVQSHGKDQGTVMLRLKDKTQMDNVVKSLQKNFPNTPEMYFSAGNWNPAELPLPEMSHFEVEISGKDTDAIQKTASRVSYFLKDKGDYDRFENSPSSFRNYSYQFTPYENIWKNFSGEGPDLNDIIDITFYAQNGKTPGSMVIGGKLTPVNVSFMDERFKEVDALAAYPFKIDGKVIPLSALGRFNLKRGQGDILRREGREKAFVTAKLDKDREHEWEGMEKKYAAMVEQNRDELIGKSGTTIEILPAQKELIEALDQFKTSLSISLALIFLVLLLQFQSVGQVLIIMLVIPLGIIGALASLFVFKSTLSLNSALGVILLNGVAVNNSILLVDVFKHLRDKGVSHRLAIIEACRSRLRPILITSLTTILGMVPIAFGWGDGGKILQPLGIVVAFGMLFSTTMALILIPIVMYREDKTQPILTKEMFEKAPGPVETEVQAWQ